MIVASACGRILVEVLRGDGLDFIGTFAETIGIGSSLDDSKGMVNVDDKDFNGWLTIKDLPTGDFREDASHRFFMNWCSGPAIFPFEGKDHLVPCTLGYRHAGVCIPAQHQPRHDCEFSGCDNPELIERYGLKDDKSS